MDIEEFMRIEKRIDAAVERQVDAAVQRAEAARDELHARWESGKEMLAERKGKQLPKGRLDELVEASGKGVRELQYRMQFAEQYPTEDKVRMAMQTFPSWVQVKKSLPKDSPRRQSKKEELAADPVFRERVRRGDKQSDIAKDMGVGEMPSREATTIVRAKEEGRAEGLAEATAPAWDTIPGNQQQKLERAKSSIRRGLEREFHTRLLQEIDQHRARLDADFAAHKAAYDKQNAAINAMRDEERRRYRQSIDVYRAKGLITPDEYNLIRSCLHPDSRASVTDEKLAAAFRVFNDSRIRTLLVKEK